MEGIVKSYPQSRIFYATYSRRLQEETSRLLLPYPNVYACTLHGLACKLFGANIFDDAKLIEEKRKASLKNEFPRWRYRPFDIIIIDEIQDCTEILYWLLAVFFSANAQAAGGRSARIVVLGGSLYMAFAVPTHAISLSLPKYLLLFHRIPGKEFRFAGAFACRIHLLTSSMTSSSPGADTSSEPPSLAPSRSYYVAILSTQLV